MTKKKFTFKPVRNWIIMPDPRKEETESGIILPESVKEAMKTNILEVLEVGPEVQWVKKGDTVMLDPAGKGHIVMIDEESYVMAPEHLVLGVM